MQLKFLILLAGEPAFGVFAQPSMKVDVFAHVGRGGRAGGGFPAGSEDGGGGDVGDPLVAVVVGALSAGAADGVEAQVVAGGEQRLEFGLEAGEFRLARDEDLEDGALYPLTVDGQVLADAGAVGVVGDVEAGKVEVHRRGSRLSGVSSDGARSALIVVSAADRPAA